MRSSAISRFLRRRASLSLRMMCTHAEALTDVQGDVKPFETMPGPKPLPIVGNIWRYLPIIGEYTFEKIHRTYEKMYKQYGPIVREELTRSKVMVHVFNPEDILTVYHCSGQYPMRKSHHALAKYRKERPDIYKNVGLFPSNGEEWYRFRKLFQKILLSPHTVDHYSPVLEEISDDLVARIAKRLDSKNEFDLQPELLKFAVECVGAVTLNRRLGCLSEEGNKEISQLLKAAHDTHEAVYITETSPFFGLFATPSYKRLVAAQDFLASVVEKNMKDAASDPEKFRNSLQAKMLAVPEADHKDVFTMILDLFLAGIDSTAYTTSFALYNLCKNQKVQSKLREELVQFMPEKSERIWNKTENMRYLHLVVKESLRLNPVSIGNGRVLEKDLVLSGYRVPAGTHAILHHQTASKLEENFPEPELFLPERWETPSKGKPQSYFITSAPFGYGARSCVGRRFAQREMYLVISKLLRNYRIEYHYEDIDSYNRLINVPDKPLRFRFFPI